MHVRLVISLGIHYSTKNYHTANKEVRNMQFVSKTIFEEKAVKSKSRQAHYPQKFIPQKLQILAIFGDSRNIIPSKIPCLMVTHYNMPINCELKWLHTIKSR